ncbi:MAG: PCRF domain-containing protein, partial [Acidimicrobiales bacterium]
MSPDQGTPASRPDFEAAVEELGTRLANAEGYLRLDELSVRLAALEKEVAAPDLWSDQDRAREVNTAYTRTRDDVEMLAGLRRRIGDVAELLEIAELEGPEALAGIEGELRETISGIGGAFDGLELRSLFSGEHDEGDAIAEIHAGAGGTDAQDWAEMLLRMYLRWAERRGLDV